MEEKKAPSGVVYFAHSMRDYNDPDHPLWVDQIARIPEVKEVIDPSKLFWDELVKRFGSTTKVYLRMVLNADCVVCKEYQVKIGRGVYEEVSYALQMGKPAFVLRDGCFKKVKYVHLLNPGDWAVGFGTLEIDDA